MEQYTKTNISGALKIKKILDSELVERFNNIALRFLTNYTGEYGGQFTWPSPRDEISTLDGKVSLGAKVEFKKYSVVGHLLLSEAGYEDGSDQLYLIEISPDFNVECYFGGNTINVLPSRMVEHYRKILSALENAIRKRKVEPTRYIPTNKDTLTKFSAKDLMENPLRKKVMKINKTLRKWGYDIDDSLERLDLNDKFGEWKFAINPLNGLIRDLDAEMLGGIRLHNWVGYAALDSLETELLKVEKIVSDIIRTKDNEIVLQAK